MRVLLVSNSKSGSADDIDVPAALRECGCEVVVQARVKDAARWGEDETRVRGRDVERVVVAGGDGSLGCAAALARRLDVPLGVVPAGTANDFARVMGLPDENADAACIAGSGHELREVDLARVAGRPFLNVASMGLAPQAADAASRMKGPLGAFAYPVGAAVAAIRGSTLRLTAVVDGEQVWDGEAWQVMVASTGAFGGWADVGVTDDSDGHLDLVVVPSQRLSRELVGDAAALMRGELTSREGVLHARGSSVVLRPSRRSRLVVDGELVRPRSREVRVEVDGTVRVVVG